MRIRRSVALRGGDQERQCKSGTFSRKERHRDRRAGIRQGRITEGAFRARGGCAQSFSGKSVVSEIEKRDELGSTGIGGGVSLPHARFREVTKPYGLFARLRQPIEFQAIDGEPVDLVFLLLLPASSQLDQLDALAAVARKLRDPEVLARLRSAKSASDAHHWTEAGVAERESNTWSAAASVRDSNDRRQGGSAISIGPSHRPIREDGRPPHTEPMLRSK